MGDGMEIYLLCSSNQRNQISVLIQNDNIQMYLTMNGSNCWTEVLAVSVYIVVIVSCAAVRTVLMSRGNFHPYSEWVQVNCD